MAMKGRISNLPTMVQAAAWALAKSRVAQQAFTEALTKGTLRPRMLKAREEMSKNFRAGDFFGVSPEVLGGRGL